jgi:hypothetical protein
MSLRPTHYSRFSVDGAELDALTRLYSQWTVGTGPFASGRAYLIGLGMPPELEADQLLEDGDHRGRGSLIRVRRLEREWNLQIDHRDLDDGSTLWHHFVRVVDDRGRTDAVVVEHLAGFVPAPRAPPQWMAFAPQTVRILREQYGRRIRPHDLFSGSPLARVDAEAIEQFVTHVLLAEERESHLVVVSCPPGESLPILDTHDLATRLEGMATVAQLTSPRASWELTRALEDRGFDPKLGCYGGAVRLYRPSLRLRPSIERHPLLLPVWLENIALQFRAENTAGRIADLLTREHVDPGAWMTHFDRIDQHRRRDDIRESLKELSLRKPEPEATEPAALGDREQLFQEQIAKLQEDLRASEQLMEENARELDAAREESEKMRVERDEALDERAEAEKNRAKAFKVTCVEDAVRIASLLYPERLRFFVSALDGAKDSIYRKPQEVFDVLMFLAVVGSTHRGSISERLHETFGARVRYKAKDSPETMTKFGTERTFRESPRTRREMQQHVTLGHGMRPDASLQIYFEIGGKGVVEVAYVGSHLSTVSENT